MIAYLRGTVRHLDETSVVVDVGGVGYEVLLPAIEARALRARLHRDSPELPGADGAVEGREATLWTYYHAGERQPRPLLIGFHERENREFFELLLSVSAVGPTIAAKSMTVPVCEYASAIERRDSRALASLPGIGKRKAEQIVATLKGRALRFALLPPPELEEPSAPAADDFVADAEAVLIGLGHRPAEAARMLEAARRRCPDLTQTQELLEEVWRGEQPAQ